MRKNGFPSEPGAVTICPPVRLSTRYPPANLAAWRSKAQPASQTPISRKLSRWPSNWYLPATQKRRGHVKWPSKMSKCNGPSRYLPSNPDAER